MHSTDFSYFGLKATLNLTRASRASAAVSEYIISCSNSFALGWIFLGNLSRTLAILCTQHRCASVPGKTFFSALQKPRAPSPTAKSGAFKPLCLRSRKSTAHDSCDSRWPGSTAISSFTPSFVTPIRTSRHCLLSSPSRTLT